MNALRYAFHDLQRRCLAWCALAITLCTAGTGSAISLALLIGDPTSSSLSGTVLVFVIVSVVATVALQCGLVIAEHRRAYAKLILAGMPRTGIAAVLILQVGVVAAVGALAGILPAWLLLPLVVHALSTSGLATATPPITGTVIVWTVVINVLAGSVGVLGIAWRMSRQRPLATLRASRNVRARPGVGSTLTGVTILIATIALCRDEEARTDPGTIPALMLCATVILTCFAGWYLPLLLQWTRVLRWFGVPLHIAGSMVRQRSGLSVAQLVPWLFTFALLIALGSSLQALVQDAGTTMSDPWIAVMLITPALVPAVIAAVGSWAVMAPSLRSDARTLRRAGARERDRLVLAVGMSAVLTFTVCVLGGVLTLVGVAMSHLVILGTPFPPRWWAAVMWPQAVGLLTAMWAANTLAAWQWSRPHRARPHHTVAPLGKAPIPAH